MFHSSKNLQDNDILKSQGLDLQRMVEISLHKY